MTLTAIQSRLYALVAAIPLLKGESTEKGYPVLIEDKGNLVADLEQALETQSLAVVVALQSGECKGDSLAHRVTWAETFEIVIHRGPLEGDDVPSTLEVLEEITPVVHAAPIDADNPHAGSFECRRHELRESGDGGYCRVLTVGLSRSVS
jgi:hypothetical protein